MKQTNVRILIEVAAANCDPFVTVLWLLLSADCQAISSAASTVILAVLASVREALHWADGETGSAEVRLEFEGPGAVYEVREWGIFPNRTKFTKWSLELSAHIMRTSAQIEQDVAAVLDNIGKSRAIVPETGAGVYVWVRR